MAVNKLEGDSYFQKGRTVDKYLDEFRDLIADSLYMDLRMTVVKFCRGLNPKIANAIGGMADQPGDTDMKKWYQMALQLDQNRATNAAFHSVAPHSIPTTRGIFPIPKGDASPMRPVTAISADTPRSVSAHLTRDQLSTTDGTCCRCRASRYWMKDCLLKYDV